MVDPPEPAERPLVVGGVPPLPELEPLVGPREIPNRAKEAARVVKRLLAIVADHTASAARLKVTLGQESLYRVADALLAESQRQDPQPWLNDTDELTAYVLRALYDELLEEPSNILFTTQVSAEVVRYEAMDAAFWRECLDLFRKHL